MGSLASQAHPQVILLLRNNLVACPPLGLGFCPCPPHCIQEVTHFQDSSGTNSSLAKMATCHVQNLSKNKSPDNTSLHCGVQCTGLTLPFRPLPVGLFDPSERIRVLQIRWNHDQKRPPLSSKTTDLPLIIVQCGQLSLGAL